MLHGMIDALIALTGRANARLRNNACHYLSLIHSRAVLSTVRALLNDIHK